VGGITLSEQTRPIQGGLLLSSGAVEVNCALETLVRLSRTELTHEVSELLFS
jgi:V/A-type H+-transporting ATPase subunit E